MALKSKVLPVVLLAAAFLFAASCFVAPRGVGAAPPAAAMQRGRTTLEARGGGEGPRGSPVEDPAIYIIGMSVFMIGSVVANAAGFFGPW
mmetsp:Transcript_125725/g.391519  ORF Transcript_125725/g.391519 Transcript_125725/m.391519 type:complete len:90 (-) Transcript_125725:104-373(-)